MNNIFSIRRFSLLTRKTFFERPRYLVGLLGLVLVGSLLIFSFFSAMGTWEAAHGMTLLAGLAGGGCFITASVFSRFTSRAEGASYLTLPASHFEKWLCTVVMIVLLFLPLFLGFYRLMDSIFIHVYISKLDPHLPDYKYLIQRAHIQSFHDPFSIIAFITFFNATGIMLLGTLYFNRVSFIKTGIIMCFAFVLTFIINYFVAKLFLANVSSAVPFESAGIMVGKEVGDVELPATALLLTSVVARYIGPLCFWGLALLKLKEKEF